MFRLMCRRPSPTLLLLWLLAGCHAPVLSVDDAVVVSDRPTRLVAFVEQEPVLGLRKDVEKVPVHFYAGDRELGSDRTDTDGQAALMARLEPGAQRYEARAYVAGQRLSAVGRVFAWDPGRVAIAVDVDQTIERTDYDKLILKPSADPSPPVGRAAETLRTLARDYHLVYFTGRPRFLLEKTRHWLDKHGFPPGPVITSKGLRDVVRPGEFKRQRLRRLRHDWPNLLVGIGDKPSDADAYGANGMLSLVVAGRDQDDFGPHALVFSDWESLGRFFDVNRETLTDPAALREVLDGRRMLLQPVLPYRER